MEIWYTAVCRLWCRKQKTSVSKGSPGGNTLLMRELKGKWSDWFDLTWKPRELRQPLFTVVSRRASQNVQHVRPWAPGSWQQRFTVVSQIQELELTNVKNIALFLNSVRTFFYIHPGITHCTILPWVQKSRLGYSVTHGTQSLKSARGWRSTGTMQPPCRLSTPGLCRSALISISTLCSSAWRAGWWAVLPKSCLN